MLTNRELDTGAARSACSAVAGHQCQGSAYPRGRGSVASLLLREGVSDDDVLAEPFADLGPVASTSICPSCVTFGRPCYSGQGSTDPTLSTRTVASSANPVGNRAFRALAHPVEQHNRRDLMKAPSQSTPRLKRPGSRPLCIVASPAPAARNPAVRRTQTRARKSTAGQRHNEIVIGGGHRMTAARRPSVHGGPADRSHRRRAQLVRDRLQVNHIVRGRVMWEREPSRWLHHGGMGSYVEVRPTTITVPAGVSPAEAKALAERSAITG